MANEKLIYASAARRAILKADPSLAYLIDEVKAVDVVGVVRCKDCIYNEKSSCMFSAFANPHYRPDYFCADGERREGE